MGTENYGNQNVIWDYRYPAKGSDFSKSYKNIFKPGIYEGGIMVDAGGSSINIPPFTAIMNVDSLYCIKLNTTTTVPLSITSNSVLYFVYAIFTWADDIDNYADFLLATSQGAIPANGVVLGTVINNAGTITVDNITSRTWGYYNFTDDCFKGLVTDQAITSQVASGTAPFIIASPTVSANLNADLLDGQHAGNDTGQVPLSNGTVNTDLNADTVDGYDAGNATGQVPVSNGVVNTNLNADQVDGIDESNIYNNAQSPTTFKPPYNFNRSSLNTIRATGFYEGYSMTGAPDANWWYVTHFEHVNNDGFSKQVAYSLGNNKIFTRERIAGVDPDVNSGWGNWYGTWIS